MDEMGRAYWHLIHIRSLDFRISYPDIDKYREYKSLVSNIIDSIPCPTCRSDARLILSDYQIPDVENSLISDDPDGMIRVDDNVWDYPLFIWSYNYHNMITFKISSSKQLPDIHSAFDYWMRMYRIISS